LEYLDGIVYRALQALGCAATSTAERETANYQGRVVKRQPTTAMRRQSRLPAATRSLHVRRASPEEGSGTGASYMQLLPLVAPAPNLSRLPACSFKAHQGAPYEDNANPEQLPTGLSFCTKVNGVDPSKRVVGLQGILRLQLPVKPPGAAGLVMTKKLPPESANTRRIFV